MQTLVRPPGRRTSPCMRGFVRIDASHFSGTGIAGRPVLRLSAYSTRHANKIQPFPQTHAPCGFTRPGYRLAAQPGRNDRCQLHCRGNGGRWRCQPIQPHARAQQGISSRTRQRVAGRPRPRGHPDLCKRRNHPYRHGWVPPSRHADGRQRRHSRPSGRQRTGLHAAFPVQRAACSSGASHTQPVATPLPPRCASWPGFPVFARPGHARPSATARHPPRRAVTEPTRRSGHAAHSGRPRLAACKPAADTDRRPPAHDGREDAGIPRF